MFHPTTGVESLQVVPVSQAQSWQRAGRAGREAPGVCFRLFTELTFESLEPTTTAEIQRVSMSSTVLQLHALGVGNVLDFDFMESPSVESLTSALELLLTLGALDRNGTLTDMGNKMAQLPVSPMAARMLLLSSNFNCSSDALTAISMMSVENVFYRPHDKLSKSNTAHKRFKSFDGDVVTLVNLQNSFVEVPEEERKVWCFGNFINYRSLLKSLDVRQQLHNHLERLELLDNNNNNNNNIMMESSDNNTVALCKCLTAGYFLQAAVRQPSAVTNARNKYKVLTTGRIVSIHPHSSLFNCQPAPTSVVYVELVHTSKEYVRCCTRIEAEWLQEVSPDSYTNTTENNNNNN